MANTIKTTNRTIEISAIDSDYMMDQGINVQSVVLIAEDQGDYVYIVENSEETTDPVKVKLDYTYSRIWYASNQRLQLGFVFANGSFSENSKVVFNIGERGY